MAEKRKRLLGWNRAGRKASWTRTQLDTTLNNHRRRDPSSCLSAVLGGGGGEREREREREVVCIFEGKGEWRWGRVGMVLENHTAEGAKRTHLDEMKTIPERRRLTSKEGAGNWSFTLRLRPVSPR